MYYGDSNVYPEGCTELSPEELAQIEEAAKTPYIYDEDCPLLTPEQLSEFRRVADTNEEERKQIAREGSQRRKQLEKNLQPSVY